jgi:hypothetical protein
MGCLSSKLPAERIANRHRWSLQPTVSLKVQVCSWNVGNKEPNVDEMRKHWISLSGEKFVCSERQ